MPDLSESFVEESVRELERLYRIERAARAFVAATSRPRDDLEVARAYADLIVALFQENPADAVSPAGDRDTPNGGGDAA